MKKNHIYIGLAALGATAFCATLIGTNSKLSKDIFAQTISCAHKNVLHHDEVEPTYFENGVKEDWGCCDCHGLFDHEPTAYDNNTIENTSGYDPYDSNDGRHIDKNLFRTFLLEKQILKG